MITVEEHTLAVLAGSAICAALVVVIALSLINLAGPNLARLYLERGLNGFEWEDLTPAERRVHFTRTVLEGLLPRLIGLSRTPRPARRLRTGLPDRESQTRPWPWPWPAPVDASQASLGPRGEHRHPWRN